MRKHFILLFFTVISIVELIAQVGIGTTDPKAGLHVADSSVIFTAEGSTPIAFSPTPVIGQGRRLMWYADKAAFRVGYVDFDQWDMDNIGRYSVAMGYSTIASGDVSTAFGYNSVASGYSSLAWGLASNAAGDYSVALGVNSQSIGKYSFASGYQAASLGFYAHSMGYKSIAGGDYSFSVGNLNEASGISSIALGDRALSSGDYAISMGNKATADGKYSVAIGRNVSTDAYSGSFILGDSMSSTVPTKSSKDNEMTFRFKGGYRFITRHSPPLIGVCITPENRMGIGTFDPLARLHVADSSVVFAARGDLPLVENDMPISGEGRRLVWYPDRAAFRVGYVDGNQWDTSNVGKYSIAMGKNVTASGDNSFVVGTNSSSGEFSSISIGNHCKADSFFSIAIGNYAKSNGAGSIALGSNVGATNTNSIAIGSLTKALEEGAISIGGDNYSWEKNSITIGNGLLANNQNAVAIGNQSESSGISSFAMGDNCKASGNYAFSLGKDNQSIGYYSLSMGKNATASKFRSIAIGYNVSASDTGSYAFGLNSTSSGKNAFSLGQLLTASGLNSFALGYNIGTNGYKGSFAIGDFFSSPSSGTNSSADNQMSMRFRGGYRLYTDEYGNFGVSMNYQDNSWSSISDSTKKENFLLTNGNEVLSKINTMKIGSWNYKGQDKLYYRHYGPMAQEFYSRFGNDGVGNIGNDTTIATADIDGVMMIAIQALIRENETLRIELQTVKLDNEHLLLSKEQQEERIRSLEQNQQLWLDRLQKIEAIIISEDVSHSDSSSLFSSSNK